MKRFVPLAQVADQTVVSGMKPFPAVDHKEYAISLINGGTGLARHGGVNSSLVTRNPTGVNDDEGHITQFTFPVFAITG
jgi:hypothetical protein